MAGSVGGAGLCGHCGAVHSGGRWCAQCGSPLPQVAGPQHAGQQPRPSVPTRSRTLPAVLVVVAILVLGAGSFVGARWWLSRDGGADPGGAAAPGVATAVEADSSTTVGSHPGKEAQVPAASATTATSPAGPSAVIVTATVTATPPAAAAPGTTTVTAATTPPTTAPRPESIAGVVRHDVGCDHSYVVVLASALNRGDFESAASGIGAKYPGAKYLISGSSCLNFRSQSAYVLYLGSYPTVSDACAARFAGTRDAYVKVADPAVTDRTVGCLCPAPGQLPDIGSGSEGPYVTEAQYALQRLGFYAGDGTGVFDTDTEQAVRALQSGKSLPVDGRLTATTWPALTAADCAG